MALEFINKRGDIYYVKSKTTKTGKTTCFVTKKKDENCLDIMPFGYEVFENHDSGAMHVRLQKACEFEHSEIKLVEKVLKSNTSIGNYKLDIYGDMIKIYVQEKLEPSRNLPQIFIESLALYARYSELMRIVVHKTSPQNKTFEVFRYCFRGSIDDWIPICRGTNNNFEDTLQRTLMHLGEESYYELFDWSL